MPLIVSPILLLSFRTASHMQMYAQMLDFEHDTIRDTLSKLDEIKSNTHSLKYD